MRTAYSFPSAGSSSWPSAAAGRNPKDDPRSAAKLESQGRIREKADGYDPRGSHRTGRGRLRPGGREAGRGNERVVLGRLRGDAARRDCPLHGQDLVLGGAPAGSLLESRRGPDLVRQASQGGDRPLRGRDLLQEQDARRDMLQAWERPVLAEREAGV